MKARVTRFVNIRSGSPEVLPNNNIGNLFFNPGDVIDIAEAVVGQEYKGNSTWYKLVDGAFVWSGAVAVSSELNALLNSSLYASWMNDLKIPEIWEFTKGKGVGVGVVDTGINLNNDDLAFNKTDFYLFDKTQSLQDSFGHGTHCAALIGARNIKRKFIGVAPESNLYICKFSESGSLSDSEAIRYAEAIDWCNAHKNIHIISISWGGRMKDPLIKDKVEAAVNAAVANNKIVLCAMGDAFQDDDSSKRYPACFDNSIGIGSIPVVGKLFSFINEHLVTIVDGLDIASYKHNDNTLVTMSGTSQSTAIVAGVVALIINKLNFIYTPVQIKKLLRDLSDIKPISGKSLPCLSGEKLLNFFKS
ncbi:hypothetical protein BH11BAC3_BH11BAC3_08670 [soil metagenome]